MRSNEVIFHSKGFSDAEIDNRVLQILRRVAFDLSPSRKGNSKGASLLAASPESKPLSPVPVKVSRAPSAKAASANKDSATPRSSSFAVVQASPSAAPSAPSAVRTFSSRTERVSIDLTGPDDQERAVMTPSPRLTVAASKGLDVEHLHDVIIIPDVDDCVGARSRYQESYR
ncbi:MAG: hypothetical protein M1830_003860 [Pleopsidium flavum]|nr:MAG: hypothetical protein M1830_003860 [Pleopsidium flavum]